MRKRYLAGALALALLAQPAWAGGEVEVSCSYGEAVEVEDGEDGEAEYKVSPSSSLGLSLRWREAAERASRPDLGYAGYLTLTSTTPAKSGLTVDADWEPLSGPFAGRRYSFSGSLAQRWPGGSGDPEQAWETGITVRELGLKRSAMEAGAKLGEHVQRLSGTDYREGAAYLSTRVVIDGEPAAFDWLDPEWLGGFTALLVPPPEPGSEERTDLPAWYDAGLISGLPALPPPGGDGQAGQGRPSLSVSARHTQTTRDYRGESSSDWEAGVTRLEVAQRSLGGEVAAVYATTLKHYPIDPERTYRLHEGSLELSGPAGAGRGNAALTFRNRLPWEGGEGAYRQGGIRAGWSLPGAKRDFRLGAEWRRRDYLDGLEDDYTNATLESELSWPGVRRTGGPWGLTGLSWTTREYVIGQPAEHRLRVRLSGELPAGRDRHLSAGFAWERTACGAVGDILRRGSIDTLLRLSWSRRF